MPTPTPSGASRGAATRVVDVQRQAAKTLRLTLGFAIAAPISAWTSGDLGRWLPVHVFLIGAVLAAVSAATQLLAVTWSASPAPPDAVATVQRWLVVGGAVTLLAGRATGTTVASAAGGAGVLAGLVLLAAILVSVRRHSGNSRFHPAIDGYLTALAWAVLGIGLGLVLAFAEPGSWWSRTRDAHVTVNLLGLVGLVIASTLPFFVATQARTKMSTRATPVAMRTTTAGLTMAVAVAATGQALDLPAMAAAGFIGYGAALVWSLRLWPSIRTRQLAWAGPRLLQLIAGMVWWIGSVGLLGAGALVDTVDIVDTARLVPVVVVGGFAQILVASLAYLGPVLRGGGHERLTAGFTTTRSVASLVLGNVAAVMLLAGAEQVAIVLLVTWGAVVGVTATRLVVASSGGEIRRRG